MPTSIESPRPFAASRHPVQYTLQAGLATMTVFCLLLAYLHPLGVTAVARCGLVALLGGVLGWLVTARVAVDEAVMSMAVAVMVMAIMKTMGIPAKSQGRPVRLSQTLTASSASPARSWFVAPNTGQIARHTGITCPWGVV